MIPIPALVAVISALAPAAASAIGSALGGGRGKAVAVETAAVATEVMEAVFGTTEPDEVRRLARTDPAKAAEFRVQMEGFATQLRVAEIEARVADMASARSMTQVPLIARTQVAMAWIVTITFGLVMLSSTVLEAVNVPDILLGALIAAQASVIGFFFGNSTSGHSANNTMAMLAGRTIPPTAPVAPILNTPHIAPARQPMGDEPGAADRLNERELQRR